MAYAYDGLGTNPDNLIVNERHSVQPPSSISDASFIILRAAPFFSNSLVLRTGPNSSDTALVEGVDYLVTHHFVTLSYIAAQPIYSSVTFLNRNYSGEVYATYQTVGGQYVFDSYTQIEELTRQLYNVLNVTWEQVAGNFPGLPPYSHLMSGDDIVGFDVVIDVLNAIKAAILDTNPGGSGSSAAALQAHIESLNAHSKAAVGLGNVNNWDIATLSDILASVNNKYMTPYLTGLMIDGKITDLGIDDIEQAIVNLQNTVSSHGTTIGGIQGNISDLQSGLDTLGNNYDTFVSETESTLSGIAVDITNLQDTVTSIDGRLDALEASSGGGGGGTSPGDVTRIDNLETDVAAIQNELDGAGGIDERLTTAEGDISTLQSDVADIINNLSPTDRHYGVGSYLLTIPAGAGRTIKLIGGGGSGGFNNSGDDPWLYHHGNDGGNSFISSVTDSGGSAIAPQTPMAIAKGGAGGQSTKWVTSGDPVGSGGAGGGTTANGVTFTSSSTGNDGDDGDDAISTPTAGGGGQTINTVVFGAGGTGSAYAGGGGAGGVCEFDIVNAGTEQQVFLLVVGKGGQRANPADTTNTDGKDGLIVVTPYFP